MEAPLPSCIGKYNIAGVLGHGAMGIVYKGFDPHINRPVAIKTIRRDLLSDSEQKHSSALRFRNEAQAVGRLAHPGVVAIYELGEDENTAFIAMELVEGKSLDKVLKATPQLALPLVHSLVDQLLDALQCAHQHDVWHRDIKPANLILTADGRLKLTDFGVARIKEIGLTQVSSVIGTPGYMSPEQYTGDGVDHRADLFAVGVLLYRLLTGIAPFLGNAQEVMYQVLHKDPPAPSEVARQPGWGPYDTIIQKALAKAPDERYSSAGVFRQALKDAHDAFFDHASIDEEATVVVLRTQSTQAIEAAATPIPASTSLLHGSLTDGSGLAGWDTSTLSRIERSLATYIGPIAKLMIRNASRQHSDINGLASELALHISEEEKRHKFMRDTLTGLAENRGTAAIAAFTAPLPSATEDASGSAEQAKQVQPISEAYKMRIEQAVIRRLGPIGKVIVSRASRRTTDRSMFLRAVIDACPEADQDALSRELRMLD